MAYVVKMRLRYNRELFEVGEIAPKMPAGERDRLVALGAIEQIREVKAGKAVDRVDQVDEVDTGDAGTAGDGLPPGVDPKLTD